MKSMLLFLICEMAWNQLHTERPSPYIFTKNYNLLPNVQLILHEI